MRVRGKSVPANLVVGGGLIAILALAAVLAPVIAPMDPLALDLRARMAGPGGAHLLGADEFGRDLASRLLYGARTSALIATATTAAALTLGLVFGILAGFFGGLCDRIVMIFNDAFLAFPGLLLALGFMAVFGASQGGIVMALGLAYAPVVVRITRGTVMSIRAREFVEASRVSGNSELWTMLRHVLPNCLAPVIVLATTMFGWIILSESALSFLGLGVPPPAPSWGNMLSTARPHAASAPHLVILPGLCISLALLGANLLGDALRDWLDPRMKR